MDSNNFPAPRRRDPAEMRKMLWYVASPYGKYEGGTDKAYEDVCREMALLLDAGVRVFGPIAHTHGLSKHMAPKPHKFWMTIDRWVFDACDGLIIVKLPGWWESEGVMQELAWATQANMPVVKMDPGVVPEVFLTEGN